MRLTLILILIAALAIPADAQLFAGRGRYDEQGAFAGAMGSETCWKVQISAFAMGQLYVVRLTETEVLRKLAKRNQPMGETWRHWLSSTGSLQHAKQKGPVVQVDPHECPWVVKPEASVPTPVDASADRAELCEGLGIDCSATPKGLFSTRKFARWALGKIRAKVLESCPNLNLPGQRGMQSACAPCADVLDFIEETCEPKCHHGTGNGSLLRLAGVCNYTGGSK